MVATIDGKTVTDDEQGPIQGISSENDRATMRGLQNHADAVLIGAETLRRTPRLWYPLHLIRIVATRSGSLNYSVRFFMDAPEKAFVICPPSVEVPDPFKKLPNDFRQAFHQLRTAHGVQNLLIEGGSHLNGEVLHQDLIDELFLTLAPKIKLGEGLPTYAGGEPLSRDDIQNYQLLEHVQIDQELFLRYRRQLRS